MKCLQKAISKTIGVVPSRSTLPILENFLFDITKDSLKITATDLEVSMTVSIDVKSSETGKIAIPAKKLVDTVRSLPETLITFSVNIEDNKIKMKTDNGEYLLIGESSEEFPSPPQFKGSSEFSIDGNVLQKVVNKTLFAVSTDELRPQMMGVFFKIENSELCVVSTDGHRLVKINNKSVSIPKLKKEIIIPSKTLTIVEKFVGNENVTISISDTHILYKFANTVMISRLIEDKYPNYESVIPSENDKKLVVNKTQLLQSVRRVALYSNNITHQIRFSVSKNELIIQTEDIDFGNEAKETIPCDYNSSAMEIGFNSNYIIDILSHLESEEIQFLLGTSTKAVIISPDKKDEKEEVLMLIMPVRLNT